MADNIPRRMRRFRRKKPLEEEQEAASPAVEGKGFRGIPSEEQIAEDLEYKKKDEQRKMGQDIESSLRELDDEDKERAKELAIEEVKSFRQRNNRLPMRSEYDQIVESIFSTMKEEGEQEKQKQQDESKKAREKEQEERKKAKEKQQLSRSERRRGRGRKEEEETEEQPPEEAPKLGIEDLNVKDVLGKSRGTGNEKEDDISLFGEEGEEGKKEEMTFTELEQETGKVAGKCGNCGRQTDKQVYCPECGQAFCEKCTKSVKQVSGKTEMQCPNCGTKTKK